MNEHTGKGAIASVLAVARGMKHFPQDAAAPLAEMLVSMANNTGEVARFAVILRDTALFDSWPGWVQIRALWCKFIGRPRDGRWADLQAELVGEQHDKAQPFAGCGRCEAGWVRSQVSRSGVLYSTMEKCECRRKAELAAGAPAGALEDAQHRPPSRGGLERADVRGLIPGGKL